RSHDDADGGGFGPWMDGHYLDIAEPAAKGVEDRLQLLWPGYKRQSAAWLENGCRASQPIVEQAVLDHMRLFLERVRGGPVLLRIEGRVHDDELEGAIGEAGIPPRSATQGDIGPKHECAVAQMRVARMAERGVCESGHLLGALDQDRP